MKKKIKPVGFILVSLLIAAVSYIVINKKATGKNKKPFCNVILISLDTLRADHLGIYGYHRDTSPYIDEMAKESILFENAYAQSPNTLISHATMLTSLQPIVHGATPDFILAEGFETLAEYFQKNGYKTAGFATHESWLSEKMGFAQGFDVFRSEFIDAKQNNKFIFDFIEKNSDSKLFLFLHYYDIHSDADLLPYDTKSDYDKKFCQDYKGEFQGCKFNICATYLLDRVNSEKWNLNEEEVQYITALYDGGISYTDFHLNKLFNKLKDLELYEKSLIVVTADHGEEFMEHGKMLHEQLYKENVHVPLIIKLPHKKEHKRITTAVGVIDIMPTILDVMGIRYKGLMGESIVPLIEQADTGNRLVYSFLPDLNEAISVRDHRYSFYQKKSIAASELYLFVTDPGEGVDISGREKRKKDELLKMLIDNLKSQRKIKKQFKYTRKKSELSNEEKEKLKSLGYLD